ncbi:hypothetical protein BO70DRAFT_365764 [Aspergillus heteromorphus CBS 117.55]|uniref:Zinc finger C2H2 LYAR-type domain-containing protein n=1 Tax=Aspergillus heteromorphus CBS 117.55 TaxID=1448321 RepID=A0A317V902_9EURO|nr:uncharacterized protein BO70DRAFT_365764 [Aspergillus heteromorphus CBS 117.55]PWY69508.1 hypothetical protein BO70DRAFT_365764 [Aspergillus heteromorphus CBS 117.55]
MVSFSCEACGDILTKKKLDPHRNQCRGATFTCIDCMVHFWGTEYRSHTSCMSEAQKYQGALYKEKPVKNQRKQQNNPKQNQKQNPHGHRAPYVEDANDTDNPPPAPSPPLAGAGKTSGAPAADGNKPVNVFDYMVAENTPNASKVSLGGSKEQMKMVANARSVFEPSDSLARVDTDADEESKAYDVAYEENGFSYGTGPIKESGKVANASVEFMTPAPKKKKDRSREAKASATTSEKKRKRRTEDHDMEDADTPMMEAPSSVVNHPGTPMLNHSGLTGGLNRMLRSPSVDDEGREDHPRRRYQDPSSPIKRTRRDEKEGNGDAGLGISMKSRAERLVSSMFGGSSVSGSSVNSREPSAKAGRHEDGRSKKLPKVRTASNGQSTSSDASKSKRKSSSQTDGDRPSRRLKQVEYSESRQGDDGREVVVYQQSTVPDGLQREMAAHFMSLVTKGPDSTRGFSMNKVLKRFHRDFTDEYDGDRGRDQGDSRADRERRIDDEKELWRTLRVKQNERGEVVLFF